MLAYMGFPAGHRAKLLLTSPIVRLNDEIQRRAAVVGIFPNEQAITRLIGAILMEQSEEWAIQRARYMTLETMTPMSDPPIVKLDEACRLAKRHAKQHLRRQAGLNASVAENRLARPPTCHVGIEPALRRLQAIAYPLTDRQ